MTATKFDHLWEFMSQHSFVVDTDSTENDLTCIICKNLMIDACQSICGCQYCYNCINGYIGDGDKYCPGTNNECNEEYLVVERDVSRNIRMNNRISKFTVKCPNKECRWFSELMQMEEHVRVCTKQPINCPYSRIGCDNDCSSEESVNIHIHEDLFKHSHLLILYVNNLSNEFNRLKEDREKGELEVTSLKGQLDVKNGQIGEVMVKMECQTKEMEAMRKSNKKKSNRIAVLENEVKAEKEIVRNMVEVIKKTVEGLAVRVDNMGLLEQSKTKETSQQTSAAVAPSKLLLSDNKRNSIGTNSLKSTDAPLPFFSFGHSTAPSSTPAPSPATDANPRFSFGTNPRFLFGTKPFTLPNFGSAPGT